MAFRSFSHTFIQGRGKNAVNKYARVRLERYPKECGYHVHFDMGFVGKGFEQTQYVIITPAMARKIAAALIRAANEMDRKKKRHE